VQDEYQVTEISTLVDPSGDSSRVCVYGEIDLATAPDMAAAALHHIQAGRHVTMDLGGATFLDAAGVSSLVALHRSAAEAGCRFTVVNADHRPVALVLRLTRAAEVLRIEASGPK
jgi:anti-anti-sigma factor